MTLESELSSFFAGRFGVLILDNEVTVAHFVAEPPLPWARLIARDGAYRIGEAYPTTLSAAEAVREGLNWDRVSETAIREGLETLGEAADLVVFGNNAGQGLALADALPVSLRAGRGVVVYGRSLPERAAYEAGNYANFRPRAELLNLIGEKAEAAGRPPALAFINTIEHDERNFHAPRDG